MPAVGPSSEWIHRLHLHFIVKPPRDRTQSLCFFLSGTGFDSLSWVSNLILHPNRTEEVCFLSQLFLQNDIHVPLWF